MHKIAYVGGCSCSTCIQRSSFKLPFQPIFNEHNVRSPMSLDQESMGFAAYDDETIVEKTDRSIALNCIRGLGIAFPSHRTQCRMKIHHVELCIWIASFQPNSCDSGNFLQCIQQVAQIDSTRPTANRRSLSQIHIPYSFKNSASAASNSKSLRIFWSSVRLVSWKYLELLNTLSWSNPLFGPSAIFSGRLPTTYHS